jgi:hypothetical protein
MYHSSGLISPFQQQPNYDITANGAIQTSSTASSASGGPAAVDSIQQLEQLVHSNLEGGQQGHYSYFRGQERQQGHFRV